MGNNDEQCNIFYFRCANRKCEAKQRQADRKHAKGSAKAKAMKADKPVEQGDAYEYQNSGANSESEDSEEVYYQPDSPTENVFNK